MSYFFYQLSRSIGVFFRTLRAFFTRKLMGIGSGIRRLTNFSRHATKAASSSLQGVMSTAQNPTGPSDYVETERLFISKALIIRVLLGIAALGLIAYFLAWPFVLSHFLTARFYEKDKRVPDWTGRVIVYADAKKKIPLYAGRLENGVLQGEGRQYDGEGVPIYEGQFRDGGRAGSGREYEAGVLIYEGQFLEDRYNGMGKSYANGQLAYEGQFADGAYDGRGKLYRDGALYYDGGFRAGLPEGSGTVYYPSGNAAYQGQFLAGKRDGTGTAYDTERRKVYSGGFADDAYNGEGTLFFADGGQLAATFEDGMVAGTVEWRKNGVLYYRGEWSDDAPNGFGTLYSKAGKPIYEGPFSGGTLDGAALLAYSTAELRDALGADNTRDEADDRAFRVVAEELGLTALCTFRTETADSEIYQIYLAAPEKSGWVSLLPGTEHTAARLPEGAEPLTIDYRAQSGVNLESGAYPAENVVADGLRTTVLYGDAERRQAVLLTWERINAAPAAQARTEPDGADSRMDALLDALDRMEGAAGTDGRAALAGRNVDEAFAAVDSMADAVSLADAMITFWEQTERADALEEQQSRIEVLLADARDAAAKGTGEAQTAAALEQRKSTLAKELEACRTALKRAELQAGAVGVERLADYALEDMLVRFDPAAQDVGELALRASAYARATGGDMSDAMVETSVKMGLLDLADAHAAAELALTRYQAAAENADSVAGAYAMGGASKAAWYETMNARADERTALCAALADFSRQANRFNQLTGGWVSRTFDWHQEVFEPLLLTVTDTDGDAA